MLQKQIERPRVVQQRFEPPLPLPDRKGPFHLHHETPDNQLYVPKLPVLEQYLLQCHGVGYLKQTSCGEKVASALFSANPEKTEAVGKEYPLTEEMWGDQALRSE